MDVFAGVSEDSHIDKDSLSEGSVSNDSLVNESNNPDEKIHIRRKGSYTIEFPSQMSQSIEGNLSCEIDAKAGIKTKTPKVLMTQSMYERPWATSKRNNSLMSAINKQREEKIRLVKEEQKKKQAQKLIVLNETQKQTAIARKRKEEELQRKIDEKKAKEQERHRIVEERKLRLAQAEEARKTRILRKMTNQEEKQSNQQASSNIMTMSCYGAVGDVKRRPGNKEVLKNRFVAQRPISSTGRVIGFGSSSPRIICENPMKHTSKHPPKISDYLMERSQILSRPSSSKMSDRMTTSVMMPSLHVAQSRPVARQTSLVEKRPTSSMSTSMMESPKKPKSARKTRPISTHLDIPDGRLPHSSQNSRSSSRQSNSLPMKLSPLAKSPREKPSSTKPVNHNSGYLDKGMVQSKSSTFPKTKKGSKPYRGKVDVHLDSDSIEEEGITLTESFNKPRSITSSVSHIKSEINRTDLSSADSLESDKIRHSMSAKKQEPVKVLPDENPASKSSMNNRALPTKDLTEADYKARLMENRRLIREKREKEREQLMKAERERRHIEEVTAREMMESEKIANVQVEDTICTTSNDDAVVEKEKPVENKEETKQQQNENTIEIVVQDEKKEETAKPSKEVEAEEKERLERKKRLDLIMSRLKKTNEESSSEGGGVSPRRAMSPELVEMDPEVLTVPTNSTFRSSLLQSMLNKGKLSGIKKTPSPPSVKDSEESPAVDSNESIGVVPLTSLRESTEDSESLHNNVNSKSSVAVRSSGIDGNSLSDANSDFVADPEDPSHSSVTSSALVKHDRGNCDGQEDQSAAANANEMENNVKENGTTNYSSASSIETEEEEIIKDSFSKDPLFNSSHNIRPLAQEGCVFQS